MVCDKTSLQSIFPDSKQEFQSQSIKFVFLASRLSSWVEMLQKARSTCKSDLCSQQPQEFCTFETPNHLTWPAFDRLKHLVPRMLYFFIILTNIWELHLPLCRVESLSPHTVHHLQVVNISVLRRWCWSRWHSRGDPTNNHKSCPLPPFLIAL